LTFPNARHLVDRAEWDHWQSPQLSAPHWQFSSAADPALAADHRLDLLDRSRAGRTIIAGGHFAGHVFGRLDADGRWTEEH
jgi:hypothetical protein